MVGKTAGGNAAFHNFHNDYVHIEDPNERKSLQRSDTRRDSKPNLIFSQAVVWPLPKSTRPHLVGTMFALSSLPA